ncbi:HAMP domain-containing sensor histidine kinase [Shouchella clausii]|uniref:sensor histidine kinase n=1 Tax=Shouchella clausii TaxID=79880 RepID=UPI00203F5370|nr:HAMP domain-containing sensor histidine kinase [Shouchella clausii]MCM3547695.1 HAMP domain-containing histidine kinase [Shouchella clausii]
MKNRIVVKWFLLISSLCLFILFGIFVGQTLFFEQYYAKNKEERLSEAIEAFTETYRQNEGNETKLQELEQTFYRENNAWITVLDHNGYIKGTKDYTIELNGIFELEDELVTYSDDNFVIPIVYLENSFEVSQQLDGLKDYENHQMEIRGVEIQEEFFPYEIILSKDEVEPTPFTRLESGIEGIIYWRNDDLKAQFDENEAYTQKGVYGTIAAVNIPEDYSHFYVTALSNSLFFERIKAFQADLLFNNNPANDNGTSIQDYEQNGIQYKLLTHSETTSNGDTLYFLTMTSLQPIDEAAEMMQEYFIYILVAVIFLILLVSLYFSKKIASPLLNINHTAKQMANLDFKERIPIKSSDEIGQLSESINILSEKLQMHIEKLQQDIEKEKQLEKTRKEFIAGVSHELKTPLSIIKSCMSILQDGVAIEKSDHYFQAMNNEVNRMDRLIVDMLELAKFESGTYKVKMDVFNIKDSIHSVCNQLSIKARDKQLHINLKLKPIDVVGNTHQIEQVMTNFLTNAIRHTPVERMIFISTEDEGNRVKISVENEGHPIDTDQLGNIWDRFYQEKKTQRSKEGTGLGLAITKNILKLHDVEYGVMNTDKGVCFYFYLPKSESSYQPINVR